MKVGDLPSSHSYTDDDKKNLKQLLEAFGSAVSLEDIASAYSEASRDLCSTAEILCSTQGRTTRTSKSRECAENVPSASSECPPNKYSGNAHIAKLKPKRSPASMGTVSNVIGREYIMPRPQPNRLHEDHKPVKLNSDDFPISEIWDEKNESSSISRSQSMDSDVEEFLYKMLGNGFQLERSVIHDVVGQCGYNMQMSIDKLLDLSAVTLENSDDVAGIATGNITENSPRLGSMSCRGQSSLTHSSTRSNTGVSNGDKLIPPQTETKKKDIQKEILEALFSVPGRIEEKQGSINAIRQVQRSPYGRAVVKPPQESIIEDFTFITRKSVNSGNEEEHSYEECRRAVLEYWVTMKEYYKAAVDAFTKNDYERAQKLMEEGCFYREKAREADEKSAKKLVEDSTEEEEFSLNVHYLEPKDALRHMKLHLASLSGLPSIRCLKFVVGTDGGDNKDGRRKQLMTKLLEKEGIPWTEEGNGWTLSIRADEIDPKKLSFAEK